MKQAKRIPVIIATIVVSLLKAMNPVHADQEPPRSLAEMEDRCEFVADGKVTDIALIEKESTPYPNGRPIVRQKFRATFQVHKLIKGKPLGQQLAGLIHLQYWQTDDDRFRGSLPPNIRVGDEFRLFGEAVTMSPDGGITIYLNNSNEVRPEGLNLVK